MRRVAIIALMTIVGSGLTMSGAEKAPAPSGVKRPPASAKDDRRVDERLKSGVRMREGSAIEDQLGTIVESGRRFWFKPADGAESVRILENLALDRIVQVIEDTRTDHLWSLSGLVTEYQGENYLLVRRSVLTSHRARPPVSGR